MSQAMTRNGYVRAIYDARKELVGDLRGIPFQEPGHRVWLSIVGMTAEGVLVENADSPGEQSLVGRDRIAQLIQSVVMSGLGRPTELGWVRKVTEEPIMNWPLLVTKTGRTVRELKELGISWCLLNPCEGGKESWAG